ncbi:hypothetical protein COBT_003563, partial [Conglomerata obtusa]
LNVIYMLAHTNRAQSRMITNLLLEFRPHDELLYASVIERLSVIDEYRSVFDEMGLYEDAYSKSKRETDAFF